MELREIVGTERIDRLVKGSNVDALRDCFSALMSCEAATVERQLKLLISRLQNTSMLLMFYLHFPGFYSLVLYYDQLFYFLK